MAVIVAAQIAHARLPLSQSPRKPSVGIHGSRLQGMWRTKGEAGHRVAEELAEEVQGLLERLELQRVEGIEDLACERRSIAGRE